MDTIKLLARKLGETSNYAKTKGRLVSARYEIKWNEDQKFDEIKFFIQDSEQIGIWESVVFFVDDIKNNRHIEYHALNQVGNETIWIFAGDGKNKILNLKEAYYFYK